MAHAEFYQGLHKINKRYCTVDGIKCRINVSEYEAIYPYKHKAISAYANALDQDVCFDLTNPDTVSKVRGVVVRY